MTSLYYAPLNKRVRSYYTDQALQQIVIDNDDILNQQLLFDERMRQNAYTIFENQKNLNSKLEEEAKVLTDELLKKKYKKNKAYLALPPSEKNTLLAIEYPQSLAIEPPKYRSDIVPYEVKQKIEEEQKKNPKGATPKSVTPKTESPVYSPTLIAELKHRQNIDKTEMAKIHKMNKEELQTHLKNQGIKIDKRNGISTLRNMAYDLLPEINKKTTGGGLKKFMKKKI